MMVVALIAVTPDEIGRVDNTLHLYSILWVVLSEKQSSELPMHFQKKNKRVGISMEWLSAVNCRSVIAR